MYTQQQQPSAVPREEQLKGFQVKEARFGSQVNEQLAQLATSVQVCGIETFEITAVCQILHSCLKGKACRA